MKRARNLLIPFLFFLCFSSCTSIDLFEKNVVIPDHAWSSSFKPEISFEVTDTTSLYNIFVVVRHSDAYHFKNLYVTVDITLPNGTKNSLLADLPLADDRGWNSKGMDDIFEHRIAIPGLEKPVQMLKGTYRFRLTNRMREDPLENIMNVGIRVEKAK